MDDNADFVVERAEHLRDLATHFVQRDWLIDSSCGGLEALRYDIPEDRLWGRIKAAFHWLFRRKTSLDEYLPINRVFMALYVLRRDKHLPDCTVGGVIAHWIEDGWYVQMVQPKIGALVAEWMTADPTSPHALAIAKEMLRIDEVQEAARKEKAT